MMPPRLSHRTNHPCRGHYRRVFAIALAAVVLHGCATMAPATPAVTVSQDNGHSAAQWVDRITWGADTASVAEFRRQGRDRYLDTQLHPGPTVLPPDVAAQIGALKVGQQSLTQLLMVAEHQRKDADSIKDDEQKKTAQQEYQKSLTTLANEAATRSLLRDLYSPNQLQEQMTWFWLNHFNVFLYKSNLRAMVGDYEDRAIRPHALGKFRDLLVATMQHPAMLRYLDNEQNAAGHINENYARELLELHTLGVGSGYTQHDVQEVARVLTGLGVNLTTKMPKVRPNLEAQYMRDGPFEFDPGRHDYGDKDVLGQHIKGRGLGESDELATMLSSSPATARFISGKLAVYFLGDDPPPALVARMAVTFERSDGDIAATLSTLFHAPEFAASLGSKFKDPIHYAVSAVRVAYDGKSIVNASPMIGWLNRMSEPLYGRITPDGYPLNQAAWASPGQMTTRFEIARIVGNNSAGLFRTADAEPVEKPAFPQLANALYYDATAATLAPDTRQALEQSKSPQEWNMLLLASPEFMHR
jgi:uncharacterized protein (DUF1800 family)